jgi:hypothetical protein
VYICDILASVHLAVYPSSLYKYEQTSRSDVVGRKYKVYDTSPDNYRYSKYVHTVTHTMDGLRDCLLPHLVAFIKDASYVQPGKRSL